MMVKSEPGFTMSALLSGRVYDSVGTCSTAARYKILGSMKITGSLHSRIDDSKSPLACVGERGITTRTPGM